MPRPAAAPPAATEPRAADEPRAAAGPTAGDAARVLDEELLALLATRRYLLDWVAALREEDQPRLAGTPAQFLRAWSDSTARVIELLKARQALAAATDDTDALLEEVVAALEASPGLRSGGDAPEVPDDRA